MTSNIDEQIRQAMRAAADGIEPPVQELVDGGLARGRRLRRRHRMVVAGTGLVAVTVVASGIVIAAQFTAGPKEVAAPGDDTSRSVVEAAPANPGAWDAADVSAEVEPISSEDVLETLIELLPPGEITDSRALPQDVVEGMSENPAAIVTFDDGAGAANVSVTLYDFPTGGGCQYPSPNVQCTEEFLDDGSTLWITQRPPTYSDGRQPELIEWWATLERPDGLQIDLRQNNAVGEKDVPATRPEPPLTVEQMKAIVTSDRWDVFQVAPDRKNEISEFRERNAAASQRLADALGAGWAPPQVTRLVFRPDAVPTDKNRSGLPDGHAYVLMSRDVLEGDRSYVDRVCDGWSEKGREWDACVEAAAPSDEPVYLQRSRSVGHSQSVPHDELWVMYENEDGDVVRVMLSVSDDPELSTPERRAEIVAWIEQQIDAMAAAATADDATTR